MKVGELIGALQKYDKELEILMDVGGEYCEEIKCLYQDSIDDKPIGVGWNQKFIRKNVLMLGDLVAEVNLKYGKGYNVTTGFN